MAGAIGRTDKPYTTAKAIRPEIASAKGESLSKNTNSKHETLTQAKNSKQKKWDINFLSFDL